MSGVTKAIRSFFTDKNGHIVIWQMPNAPLIAWIVFTLINFLVQSEPTHAILRIAATLSLLIWSTLEIISGASPFRRVIGGIVLLYISVHSLL